MKILITGLTDSGMYRVRKELMIKLVEGGHEVTVAAPASDVYPKIEQLGCKFIPIAINAHGLNPIEDFSVIRHYRRILKQEKPDIVLTFTIKPNLYCGINCRMMSIPQVMNITGFGTALDYPGMRQRFLVSLYKMVAKKVKLIFFQNESNFNRFKNWHIASEKQYKLLPGSGVNLSDYKVTPYPSDEK
ncbi:MAG: glycosyltransferase, partial [Aeriscardovia sp.]|nr:glycosyltransferase [Aeriscardovia sp.]